ncbi:uncharacterized protein LOC144355216 [Saccoglossus kowalevskii]
MPPFTNKPFRDIFDTLPTYRVKPRPTLYDVLQLPRMNPVNTQRVVFSSTKPHYTPLAAYPAITSSSTSSLSSPMTKRQEIAMEACQSVSEWVQPETANNIDNVEVQLYSMQWFWRTTCEESAVPCRGFSGRSTCLPKRSWVIAWARENAEDQYQWMWVAIETCCTCAVYHNLHI